MLPQKASFPVTSLHTRQRWQKPRKSRHLLQTTRKHHERHQVFFDVGREGRTTFNYTEVSNRCQGQTNSHLHRKTFAANAMDLSLVSGTSTLRRVQPYTEAKWNGTRSATCTLPYTGQNYPYTQHPLTQHNQNPFYVDNSRHPTVDDCSEQSAVQRGIRHTSGTGTATAPILGETSYHPPIILD